MSDRLEADAIPSSTPYFAYGDAPKYVPEIEILSEPNDAEGRLGLFVNLSAKVLANKPRYQWHSMNGAPISGRCQSNITIGPITEDDFGFYRLRIQDEVTNQTLLTRWAELKKAQPREIPSNVNRQQYDFNNRFAHVQAPSRISQSMQPLPQFYAPQQVTPKLVSQPEGGAYPVGSVITLTAHFENATHYQWYKDGNKLEGCTGNTLNISNANLGNNGYYCLFASNGFSSTSVRADAGVIVF